MKLFKQKFTSILLAAAFLVGAISTVNFAMRTEAASQAAGDLSIEYPSAPLFNASNIAPGYSEIKTITVKNNGLVSHSFSIAVDGSLDALAQVLRIEPRVFGFPVWNKTLADIAKNPDSNVIIGSIAPGNTVNVDLAAILPSGIGNDYQGTSTSSFSFVMGDESTDQSEPNPSLVATLTNSQTQGNGTGGQLQSNAQGVTVENQGANQSNAEINIDNNQQNGETQGAATSSKINCYWWWVLLIVYAAFLIIYSVLNYRANGLVLSWMWPAFGGAVLYLVHWILHSYYTPVKLCDYFIWFELIELVIYYILYRYYSNRKGAREE